MHSECVKVFLYIFIAYYTVLKDKRNHYYCDRKITGVAQARKHFLTFEGTAIMTDSEFTLHSTFLHASSLPPEVLSRSQQDANDSPFCVTTMMQAIRVRTPPEISHKNRQSLIWRNENR